MAPAADDAGASGAAAAAAAAPLNAAADVGATLSKNVHQMEWNGQVSDNSFHLFVNQTAEPLKLSWGDELRDTYHSTAAPHDTAYVGTYNFHTWRVRSESRGLIATYTGPSVILTVTADGYTTELNPSGRRTHEVLTSGRAAAAAAASGSGSSATAASGSGTATGPALASGSGAAAGPASTQVSEPSYRQRSTVLGMPIWAFDCVSDAAVSRLTHVVGSMLAHSPPALLERLVAGGASFAVFGVDQVVSDVPAHRFMRYNSGRNLDTSARGLGATPIVPVTSCGEENLTMSGDRWYPCQSILIHEVGHMVHNMGLPPGPQGVEGVLEAYREAMKSRLYPSGCYMATNEQEYWAVAVESWFESTIREDVNGGIKSRAALRRHDPRVAALLEAAFGDGEWRYWKDCPRPLAMPLRSAAAAAAAVARPAPAASASAAAAPALAAAPSWRARRTARLMVDSMLESAESSAAVRLLLRRLLCRRFLSVRRRRGSAARAGDSGAVGAPVAAATVAAAAVPAAAAGQRQSSDVHVGDGDGAAEGAAAAVVAVGALPYLPPPLPEPLAVEVPPPLPAPRGPPAAKARRSRRRQGAVRTGDEGEEYQQREEAAAAEEDDGKEGHWPEGMEVPPPLPEPTPLRVPVSPPPVPLAAAAAAAVAASPPAAAAAAAAAASSK